MATDGADELQQAGRPEVRSAPIRQ